MPSLLAEFVRIPVRLHHNSVTGDEIALEDVPCERILYLLLDEPLQRPRTVERVVAVGGESVLRRLGQREGQLAAGEPIWHRSPARFVACATRRYRAVGVTRSTTKNSTDRRAGTKSSPSWSRSAARTASAVGRWALPSFNGARSRKR